MILPQFENSHFWRQISEQPLFDPHNSRVFQIINPIFKYAYLFMKNTIFGREDKEGSVRLIDLYCLWAMVENVQINSGYFFLKHLAKLGKSNSTTPIILGGLLTQLALVLGCDLSELEVVENSCTLDFNSCLAMKMIKHEEHGFSLFIKNGFPLKLPNHDFTTIHNKENWCLKLARQQSRALSSFTPRNVSKGNQEIHSFMFQELNSALKNIHSDLDSTNEFLENKKLMEEELFKKLQDCFKSERELCDKISKMMNAYKAKMEFHEDLRGFMRFVQDDIDKLFEYHNFFRNEVKWFVKDFASSFPDFPDFLPPPPY